MLEILKFILEDIWHFLGVVVLMGFLFTGIRGVIHAIRKKEYYGE